MQDTDDGFFEKFGELLRQKSYVEEDNLKSKICNVSVNAGDTDSGLTLETSGNEEDEEEDVHEESEELDCAVVPSMDHLKRDFDIDEIKERKEEFIEVSFGMNVSAYVLYLSYIVKKLIRALTIERWPKREVNQRLRGKVNKEGLIETRNRPYQSQERDGR